MTPAYIPIDQLRTAARALFGNRWQSDLARTLGIRISLIQRYAKEGAPAWIGRELHFIALNHQSQLERIIENTRIYRDATRKGE